MRLIDADALMESLKESTDRAMKWYEDCKTYNSAMIGRAEQTIMTFNECGLRIKNAPTVDAVPVRYGHWKEDTGGYGFWICSHCGFVSEASAADLLYRYCPHCGARMDVKEGDQNG